MAITEPTTCAKTLDAAALAGEVFVHPLADVEEGALLGPGTKVWRFTHIRTGVVTGERCLFGNNVYVDAGVRIGHRVRIQNGVSVYLGVTLEDDVFVGPNVTFTNDLYPRAGGDDWVVTPTRLCRGASVGANATIVCGVTIGEYAMIAAGSVVTRDVAPFSLVRNGGPARHAGYVCVCGRRLDISTHAPHIAACSSCQRTIDVERGVVLSE